MLIYRLTHTKYAEDLSGYGSLLVPGRWNFKGHRVLYTAENSSLALLEYLAHTEGIQRRLPYLLITLKIPDTSIHKLSLKNLDPSWKEDLFTTREIGTNWLKSAKTLTMQVPSVLNEDNCNYLLNPAHKDFNKVKILSKKEITYDQRLW